MTLMCQSGVCGRGEGGGAIGNHSSKHMPWQQAPDVGLSHSLLNVTHSPLHSHKSFTPFPPLLPPPPPIAGASQALLRGAV